MSNNQKKKVMIIDDETSFLNILSTALEKAEFSVVSYSNPQEALKNITLVKPDIILLDILMPELDGFKVFEYIKRDLKESMPKVIFLTNLGETIAGTQVDEHFARSIGAAGYIKKTDDLEVMLKKVRECTAETEGQ
jgi:DNA-binding response OmpR family regulator